MPPDGQPPPPPGDRPPPPPGGPPGPPPGRPEYKVYRSGPGVLDRLRPRGPKALDRFRRDRKKPEPGPPGVKPRRKITPWRVVKWVLLAILAWILLSVILFFISAQIQEGVSDRTEEALSGAGSGMLTGSTILVVGSDKRPKGQEEPGFSGERADTIILMHVGFGSVRRLSILRDSYVDGAAGYTGKINGAFSGGGGSARLIEVLEAWLGNDLQINHVIETDLGDFPEFVDAIGGVDVNVRGACRRGRFGGRRIRLKRGEQHLDGQQAVDYARLRCRGRLPDVQRVRKQQEVLAAIKDQVLSPSTFIRLPWVAWNAPKPMDTDLAGLGLSLLFVDIATGGIGEGRVLEPDRLDGPGGSVIVEDGRREREVERLLGED